jgi:hypothetical protein
MCICMYLNYVIVCTLLEKDKYKSKLFGETHTEIKYNI